MKWIIYDEWKMKRILWLNKEMFQKSQENLCLIVSLISDALPMPSESLQISLESPKHYCIICGEIDTSSTIFPGILLSTFSRP